MTGRVCRALAGLILATSAIGLVAPPAWTDPSIIVCRPLPTATPSSAPVPPAEPEPTAADEWSIARWLGQPTTEPLPDAEVLPTSDVQLNVAWEPVRFIGYTAPSLVADPVRDRLVLYGGNDAYGRLTGEVWTKPLSGASPWTRLPVPAPVPCSRSAHTAVYDPLRDRMLVYGGYCADSCGTVWALSLSDAPAWYRLVMGDSGPGHRTGARAVYDPAGDRMVVFGGYSYETDSLMNDVWSLSLSGSPAWTLLSPAGVPPTRRTEGAVVYDSRRGCLLLFGGCDSPDPYHLARRDVWELSLGDSIAWTELHPGGDLPPQLYACATAYDASRDRMLVFGGLDSVYWDPVHGETWALQLGDDLAWSQLAPPGPAPTPRASARAVYDAARDRFVVYGGNNSDTWALSLADPPAWEEVEAGETRAPEGRYLHASVYDSARDRVLMFAGEYVYTVHADYYYTPLNDLWSLSLEPRARWEPVLRDSAPAPRHGHSAVYDPAGDRMIVFGGSSYPTSVLPYGLWQLPLADGQPWSTLAADGTTPPSRYLHTAAYDPVQRRMIVFGGYDGTGALDDAWVLWLDGQPRWQQLDIAGTRPPARWGHSAAYDPAGDRMIVFGGCDGTTYFDDTWQLRLSGIPAWSPVPTPTSPPARRLASLAWDPAHTYLVLFAGQGVDETPLADVWVLPLADSTDWIPAAVAGGPPGPRWGPTAVFAADQERIVMLQGAEGRCGNPAYREAWTMAPYLPAVAQVVLQGWEAVAGGIAMTWSTDAGAGFSATVQRRTVSEDWTDLAAAWADGAGLLRYEDRTAVRGVRYAYRLSWRDAWTVRSTPEVWAQMPLLPFLLEGAAPNPATRGLNVSFWLPDGGAARLEVLDVSGRRVSSREVGGLGPGPHVVDMDPAGALPSAVYLVRLIRGSRVLVARACVIR